jgi:hypothetical protein
MYSNYQREAQFSDFDHGPTITSEITAFPGNLVRFSHNLHNTSSSSQLQGNYRYRFDFRLSVINMINPLPLQPGKFIDPGYRW